MTVAHPPEAEFSRVVVVGDLPPEPTPMDLEADAAERAALAERFELPALESLRARLTMVPGRGGAVLRVTGRLEARVIQTCVVTLDPIESEIDAAVDLTFGEEPETDDSSPDGDFVSPDGDEPPEPMVDGVVDLGEAVAEQLSLELDPFPRKPGVAFQGVGGAAAGDVGGNPADGNRNGENHPGENGPFAVLARLKNEMGGKS